MAVLYFIGIPTYVPICRIGTLAREMLSTGPDPIPTDTSSIMSNPDP